MHAVNSTEDMDIPSRMRDGRSVGNHDAQLFGQRPVARLTVLTVLYAMTTCGACGTLHERTLRGSGDGGWDAKEDGDGAGARLLVRRAFLTARRAYLGRPNMEGDPHLPNRIWFATI